MSPATVKEVQWGFELPTSGSTAREPLNLEKAALKSVIHYTLPFEAKKEKKNNKSFAAISALLSCYLEANSIKNILLTFSINNK